MYGISFPFLKLHYVWWMCMNLTFSRVPCTQPQWLTDYEPKSCHRLYFYLHNICTTINLNCVCRSYREHKYSEMSMYRYGKIYKPCNMNSVLFQFLISESIIVNVLFAIYIGMSLQCYWARVKVLVLQINYVECQMRFACIYLWLGNVTEIIPKTFLLIGL